MLTPLSFSFLRFQKEVASLDLCLKPKATCTQSAMDTTKSPSKYVGIKSPTKDPNEVAKEVFGLCPSPENSGASPFYPMNYGGPFIPIYAQPNQFGMPYENFEPPLMSKSSSGSSSASPLGPMNAAMLPHYPQYAVPMPFHYIFGSQYPPMYGPTPSGVGHSCSHEDATTTQKAAGGPETSPPPPPLSMKVLSSSSRVNKVQSSHALDAGPQHSGGSGGGRKGNSRRGKHRSNGDYLLNSPNNVAGLTSPMKRMKVMDDSLLLDGSMDNNISAYFADVSANSTCSDEEDGNENEEVSNIMSLLLNSNQPHAQQQQQQENSSYLPLTELNQLPAKERESLEQLAGTSDLRTLLSGGFESYMSPPSRQENGQNGFGEISPDKFTYDSAISAIDMQGMDIKLTSAQEDSYLPSLDTLLSAGDDTIFTLKAAMNLDIQGVVEIATEESPGEIQID